MKQQRTPLLVTACALAVLSMATATFAQRGGGGGWTAVAVAPGGSAAGPGALAADPVADLGAVVATTTLARTCSHSPKTPPSGTRSR